MKGLRVLQCEHIRKIYQELLILRNERPDIDNILKLASNITYSTERTPLSGKYRLLPYQTIDINSLNAELGLIKGDTESIYDFVGMVEDRLREFRFVSEVWQRYAMGKIRKTMYEVAKMTSAEFINGFTEKLDLNNVRDTDKTTLEINDNGELILPSVSSVPQNKQYTARDVSIKRIGDSLTASVYGDPVSVFNRGNINPLLMSLAGMDYGEFGFEIHAKVDALDVNRIFMRIAEESRGIKVKITTVSHSGESKEVFYDIVKHKEIDVSIERQDVDRIIVTLTMNNPDVQLLDEVRYEFRVYSILLLSESSHRDGIYQTKAIDLEENVEYIQLVSEYQKTGQGYIRYYIATGVDQEGEATGFVSVNPELQGNIIPVNVTRVSTEISPLGVSNLGQPGSGQYWSIKPLKQYGSKLYNILDQLQGTTITIGDVIISSGQISFTPGSSYEVIPESVKLYRGVGDYLRKYKSAASEHHVEPIIYYPVLTTDYSWIEPIRLLFRVENEHVDNFDTSLPGTTVIYTKKTIDTNNLGAIKIEYSDGSMLYTQITNSSVNSITINSALSSVENYYITYITLLDSWAASNSVIALDPFDINVMVDGKQMVYGSDFTIAQNGNDTSIIMLPAGEYRHFYTTEGTGADTVNLSRKLSISYTFTQTMSENVTYYETNVLAAVPTLIDIIPFTPAEIAAGNFHEINGQSVSLEKSFTLRRGWSVIRSTQPYPNLSADQGTPDVNKLTGSSSSAGIVFPESIERIRPYKDSMRAVSVFSLATMSPEDGSKCFSFQDNKVMINFLPDYVDPNMIVDTDYANREGQVFICKKPNLGIDYTNQSYMAAPEKFELEFAYNDTISARKIFVKVEMGIDSPNSMVRIQKLGLNKFRSP